MGLAGLLQLCLSAKGASRRLQRALPTASSDRPTASKYSLVIAIHKVSSRSHKTSTRTAANRYGPPKSTSPIGTRNAQPSSLRYLSSMARSITCFQSLVSERDVRFLIDPLPLDSKSRISRSLRSMKLVSSILSVWLCNTSGE